MLKYTVYRHWRQQKTINSSSSLGPLRILQSSPDHPGNPLVLSPALVNCCSRKPQEPTATAVILQSSSDAGGGFDAITGSLLFGKYGLIRRRPRHSLKSTKTKKQQQRWQQRLRSSARVRSRRRNKWRRHQRSGKRSFILAYSKPMKLFSVYLQKNIIQE